MLRDQLKGTGVALVTPFKSNNDVDFDALGKVIEFIIRNGVEYLDTRNYRRNTHINKGRKN